MSLCGQRLETAVPGVAENRSFCLLGQHPKPLEQPRAGAGCAFGSRTLMLSAKQRVAGLTPCMEPESGAYGYSGKKKKAGPAYIFCKPAPQNYLC